MAPIQTSPAASLTSSEPTGCLGAYVVNRIISDLVGSEYSGKGKMLSPPEKVLHLQTILHGQAPQANMTFHFTHPAD